MAAIAHADPENFMVGELTFVRPKEWPWVWNQKLANDGMLLSIQESTPADTDGVYFRAFTGAEGSADERIHVWRMYFKESGDQLKVRSETKTVASFPVIYIEMEGTSIRASGADFSLYAAIVSTKEGRVVARMSGRKEVLDNLKIIFHEMVEHALKERESD
ncbi:MAG: hypothetical protein JWM68_5210 [Verrucomicrobiales bacterium]|nr:hypothetical protein [Verrucomicrobiales bacterium]